MTEEKEERVMKPLPPPLDILLTIPGEMREPLADIIGHGLHDATLKVEGSEDREYRRFWHARVVFYRAILNRLEGRREGV
jgi:hypothetical protein